MGLQWPIVDIFSAVVRILLFFGQIFIEYLLCARHSLGQRWPIEIIIPHL